MKKMILSILACMVLMLASSRSTCPSERGASPSLQALDNKIDALESSRKDREITALTAKVAQLESQNFTTGVLGSAIAPVNAALNALAKEVDDIKCKQPSTVSVQYPNLVAMNATPFIGGYGSGYGYGYGVPGGSYWG